MFETNVLVNNASVIALRMFRLDLEPLSSKLKNNRDAHDDYLQKTMKHIDTLRGIVEQARKLNPSDPYLEYALISSTSTSGSHSKNNTRKNRITLAASSNKKNKTIEAHPRRVTDCLLSANHDKCVVTYINDVNKHVKSKSGKSKQMEWKPTGKVVQIVLWYMDSGCSKHMTRQRSQLINFVEKFLSIVRFGNDHIAKIMRYGDYQIRNVIISRVYSVEGLGHNLFSVGFRDTNLYTLSLDDMMRSSPICLLSKASKIKSWLRHRRLSHLNFSTINELSKQGLGRGLPKLKYEKDHLCSACSLRKSKKHTHKPKSKDSIQEKLYLLHMDLCGPMRIESINGKKKPDLKYLHVFGALSYPTNDSEDTGKLKPKADIGIFIGYAPSKKAYRSYN
ncbi:integrase, catalytic region, zinc finger, CCHC-type containing protein [Tanacetum coccineum]